MCTNKRKVTERGGSVASKGCSLYVSNRTVGSDIYPSFLLRSTAKISTRLQPTAVGSDAVNFNTWNWHSGGPGFKSRCRPTWLGFFHGFPQSSRQMLGWIFIATIHLAIIHQNSYIIKLNQWTNKRNIDYTTIEIHSLLLHAQRP